MNVQTEVAKRLASAVEAATKHEEEARAHYEQEADRHGALVEMLKETHEEGAEKWLKQSSERLSLASEKASKAQADADAWRRVAGNSREIED